MAQKHRFNERCRGVYAEKPKCNLHCGKEKERHNSKTSISLLSVLLYNIGGRTSDLCMIALLQHDIVPYLPLCLVSYHIKKPHLKTRWKVAPACLLFADVSGTSMKGMYCYLCMFLLIVYRLHLCMRTDEEHMR